MLGGCSMKQPWRRGCSSTRHMDGCVAVVEQQEERGEEEVHVVVVVAVSRSSRH